MRTTLSIDDHALDVARKLATARGQSLGSVVSDLILRGLAARTIYLDSEDGFPVFRVAEDSPPITLEDVKRDEDDSE